MLSDESSKKLLATSVICCAVAISSIVLRFWCKLSLKSGIHAEDWWMLCVVPTYAAATANDIWASLRANNGKNIEEVYSILRHPPSPEMVVALENYMKSVFIWFFLRSFKFTFIRISICLFYRRIFVTRGFRIRSAILIGLSMAWFITAFVVSLILCIPIEDFWHPLKRTQCINFNLYHLIMGVFQAFIDAAILAFAIRATFQVQLPLKSKLLVSGLFLLGGFAVITNILCLYNIYDPRSSTVALSEVAFWMQIHCVTAVICANLPVSQPLRAQLVSILGGIREKANSSFRSLRSNPKHRIEDSPDGLDLDPDLQMRTIAPHSRVNLHKSPYHYSEHSRNPILVNNEGTNVATARYSDGSLDSAEIPPGGIVHTRRVEVV